MCDNTWTLKSYFAKSSFVYELEGVLIVLASVFMRK